MEKPTRSAINSSQALQYQVLIISLKILQSCEVLRRGDSLLVSKVHGTPLFLNDLQEKLAQRQE